ncbi:Phthiocerol synthesis polyketide synthase type I PpsC [compost metagenome]
MLTRLNPVAKEIWTKNGFNALSTKEGLRLFEAAKNHNGELSVMPVVWEKWLKQYPKGCIPDTLLSLADYSSNQPSANVSHTVGAAKSVAARNRSASTPEAVYNDISTLLKRVLQRSVTTEELNNHSFQEMGLDSLMSVEFRNLLNESYASEFPISLLYSYPDLGSLSCYICSEVLCLETDTEVEKMQQEPSDQAPSDSEDRDYSLEYLREQLDKKLKLYDSTISY